MDADPGGPKSYGSHGSGTLVKGLYSTLLTYYQARLTSVATTTAFQQVTQLRDNVGCWLLAGGCWLLPRGCWLLPGWTLVHHFVRHLAMLSLFFTGRHSPIVFKFTVIEQLLRTAMIYHCNGKNLIFCELLAVINNKPNILTELKL